MFGTPAASSILCTSARIDGSLGRPPRGCGLPSAMDGRPLSDDWEHPDVLCLTQRIDDRNAFLCGTLGGLYLNVSRAPDPLGMWVPAPLRPGVNAVYRI